MRSIRLLAVTTGALLLGSACGGDNGGVDPDENDPPVAGFTEVCTELSCVFTDASTDPDGDATITAWSWNFGDNTTSNAEAPPAKVYAAAGTYTVVLTVTDDEGVTDDFSKDVVVSVTVPGNTAPTASFDLPTDCTAGTPCGFHSTSTDADGVIATTNWDFGDGETGEGTDATHTYAAAGTFTVTLGVTDDDGAAATTTQQLTVAPVAVQDCTTTGTLVDCALGITQNATVKITIVSQDCELSGNKLTVTPAGQSEQTAFFNLCNRAPGEEYEVKDATGLAPLTFTAGSTVPLRFHQGPQGTNPPVSDPGIQVTGTFPNWTLNIDDGGAAGTAGEPDFNDVVISVTATTVP